jgi:hypothetical protein
MTLEVTNGSQDRIDAIVMRCDYQTRMISETIKKGAYASSPVAPALQRDANAYEICLAQIRVSKTATSITQANITDTRQNSSLCGIINSLITVNPDGLFMQFQSEWNNFFSDVQDSTTEWLSEQQQTFEDWFGTIEDMLDDNQASQMAGQIAAINSSIAALQAETVVASATSLLVPAASWSKIGALWSANIAIPTYDGIYSPIVCFGNADALFGDLLNFCNGSNGVVTIYSNRIVTRDITIPLIYWVHDN